MTKARDSEPDALALSIEPVGDREVKLAFVRKLILAVQKSDEHAALDALDDLIDECVSSHKEPDADDEE